MINQSLDDELREILDEYAGNYKPREYIDKILSAFNARIPKPYGGTIFNLPDYQEGWNAAIASMKESLGVINNNKE